MVNCNELATGKSRFNFQRQLYESFSTELGYSQTYDEPVRPAIQKSRKYSEISQHKKPNMLKMQFQIRY